MYRKRGNRQAYSQILVWMMQYDHAARCSTLPSELDARDISLSTKSILSFLWTISNETYIIKIPSSRRIQIYRSPEMNISYEKHVF